MIALCLCTQASLCVQLCLPGFSRYTLQLLDLLAGSKQRSGGKGFEMPLQALWK